MKNKNRKERLEQHILFERLKGLTDPAIAYELLTTTQLNSSERTALESMLLDDLGLSYTYAKANRLLGKWPEFDAALTAADTHAKLERNEFLDLYIYMRKVISGTP